MDRKDLAQASEALRPDSSSRTSATGINQLLRQALSPSRSPSPTRSRRSGRSGRDRSRSRSPSREGRRDETHHPPSRRERDERYRSYRAHGHDHSSDFDRRREDPSRRYDDRGRRYDGRSARGRPLRSDHEGHLDAVQGRDRYDFSDRNHSDHPRRYDDFSHSMHPCVPQYGSLADRTIGGPRTLGQNYHSFSYRAPGPTRGRSTNLRPSPLASRPHDSGLKCADLHTHEADTPSATTSRGASRKNVSFSRQDPTGDNSVHRRQEPSAVLQDSLQVASSFSDDVDKKDFPRRDRGSKDVEENDEPQAPVDEAVLVEERRRRREAIKARHAAESLHSQAVHNSARPDTPSRDAVSPSASLDASALGSPAPSAAPDSSNSGKMSPSGLSGGDGLSPAPSTPKDAAYSAADYDPTADREEDFARAQNRKVEETKDDEGNAADMFSADNASDEDDDEDMFASPQETGKELKPAKSGGTVLRRNLDDAATLENGYYRVLLGELMHGRYHVHNSLGHGAFSEVFDATDKKTGRAVAIKSMRQYGSMAADADNERAILQELKTSDPGNQHIVRLLDSFHHLKHVHLVFEGMKMNLRDVIKKFGSQVGLHQTAVRSYTRQMLLGLSVVHKCELIHGDIKPDNMLVDESQQLLKVCDFGSVQRISDRGQVMEYLVSRFYRAPEVILGLTLDYALDMWSIGCTIFELATSEVLFRGENNNGMLRAMQEVRGKYPPKLVRLGSAKFADMHFGAEQQTFLSRSARDNRVKEMTFGTVPAKPLKPRLMGKFAGVSEAERQELLALVELIESCVSFYAERRPTAEVALSSRFVVGVTAKGKKAAGQR